MLKNDPRRCHSEPFAVTLSPSHVILTPQQRGKDLALAAQGKLREESRSENKDNARFLVVPQLRDSSE